MNYKQTTEDQRADWWEEGYEKARDKKMTEQDQKQKLFWLWGKSMGLKWGGDIRNLTKNYEHLFLSEIQKLMEADGISREEIEKCV